MAIAVLIRNEGWRNQTLSDSDLLPYFLGAEAQLHSGTFLDHGDLSSYNSFAPPGTVYWVLMGAAVMPDLRLYALPANFLLNLAAAILLYLLLRNALGRAIGMTAGLVYCISLLGYQSIWPIGHPAYILSILTCTVWWIRSRNAWALFFACVIGAFGLYVDLAILPFLLILPFAWLIFRPPLRFFPILAALLIGILIWIPYLRFEVPRNFIDIRSLLLREPIQTPTELAPQVPPPYCIATLPGEPDMRGETYIPYLDSSVADRLVYPQSAGKGLLYYRVCMVFLNLDRNFDDGYFLSASPAIGTVGWIFFIMGMFLSVTMLLPSEWAQHGWLSRLRTAPLGLICATLLIAAGFFFLLSGWMLGNLWAEKDHAFLLVGTQIQYYLPWMIFAGGVGMFLGLRIPRVPARNAWLLFCTWIPWLVLVLLAEPGRPERFWWLWPLQAAVMVFALHQFVRAWTNSQWALWFASAAMIIAVIPLPSYLPRIQNAIANGYAGEDPAQIRIADYIGRTESLADHKTTAVGYRFANGPYLPVEDLSLWPGSWFDLLLLTRWRIENIDHPAAGISDKDEWLIWVPTTLPCQADETENLSWKRYELVLQSGPYYLFQATENP
jgi:hypothetical protein